MTETKAPMFRTIYRSVALAAGVNFIILAAINLSRWEVLEGWYRWAALSGLLGGLLLVGRESFNLPFPYGRIIIHLLLAFGSLLPLDALAFFTIMRIPMDWQDYLTFAPPPILLLAWWSLLFASQRSGNKGQ